MTHSVAGLLYTHAKKKKKEKKAVSPSFTFKKRDEEERGKEGKSRKHGISGN